MSSDGGLSANDIITYVGVPFAVLGVLPILYNTVSTLVGVANVKRLLKKSRLVGITRGDVVNHVIEVDLPRFVIAPLDREHAGAEYWNIYEHPSLVRGGSWTVFNWKMHTIGYKTQRIVYSDQLRQPQAEINFEELIGYLTDLGAVPHAPGFRMLRSSGLWTPAGTPLLLSPTGEEVCLSIAPLDDSDGNLSLSVKWSRKWKVRDKSSLPPYWLRLNGQAEPRAHQISDETKDIVFKNEDAIESSKGSITQATTGRRKTLSEAVRCHVTVDGLVEAQLENHQHEPLEQLNVSHLCIKESGALNIGVWYASAITAFGANDPGVLRSYDIPDSIIGLARKDTIPCGILVLLDIVAECDTPEWATTYDDREADRELQARRMRETNEAVMKEMKMSEEQRKVAVRERHMKQATTFFDENKERRRQEEARMEQRVVEAMSSLRWDTQLVAQHNLCWLQAHNLVSEEDDIARVTEILLYKLIRESDFIRDVAMMLDLWQAWTIAGGMKRADFLLLKEHQEAFAWTSLLMACVRTSSTHADGFLARDLQESVRMWKRVRLG